VAVSEDAVVPVVVVVVVVSARSRGDRAPVVVVGLVVSRNVRPRWSVFAGLRVGGDLRTMAWRERCSMTVSGL
jgi:hypothetical protein